MPDTPTGSAPIPKRWSRPLGVLPQHLNKLAMGGLALAMVMIIAFSNRQASVPPREMSAPASPVVDPNEQRIQEYRQRIEEQARRLALEQEQLARTQEAIAGATGRDAAISLQPSSPQPAAGYAQPISVGGQPDWIETDRQRREYESRYASNVALTHRPASTTPQVSSASGGGASQPGAAGSDPGGSAEANKPSGSTAKTHRLFEGTVIETVLTNRLDGTFSGPVNCLVTTHVYSHDRTKLLIPQGTRVLGEVSRVETFGQQRLAVSFHRLIMPDGYSATLEKQPGLSAVGETGLVDQINHHYGQIFGVSLAIGAIAGLSQANTSYGPSASSGDVYRQGVSESLSQTSLNILDRYLNVLPTFTIREGHRVKVYLTADLLLPAYDNHPVTPDL